MAILFLSPSFSEGWERSLWVRKPIIYPDFSFQHPYTEILNLLAWASNPSFKENECSSFDLRRSITFSFSWKKTWKPAEQEPTVSTQLPTLPPSSFIPLQPRMWSFWFFPAMPASLSFAQEVSAKASFLPRVDLLVDCLPRLCLALSLGGAELEVLSTETCAQSPTNSTVTNLRLHI